MRLLDIVSESAELFLKVSEVARYLELRRKLQKACPEGWYYFRKLELEHWKHFRGIPIALNILRQNISNNPKLPESMSRDIQSLIDNKFTRDLENQAEEIANFVDGLSHYLLKPEANLEAGKLSLTSALRRVFLNAKGCLQGTEEFRNIRRAIAKGSADTKEKAELYEQEMLRRKIILPILPESYDLVLEIAGTEIRCKKALIATKQLFDMVKIIQQLLFNLTVFGKECSLQVDGNSVNLQHEDKPYGRNVKCHMINIPPLMIPGQILCFVESSSILPIYVGLLSVEWKYDGKIKETIIDLSGIDLEDAGPNLLSRINENQ